MFSSFKKVTPELGDIIAIPFNGKIACAKIIWISTEFEDTFGFVVSKQLLDNNDKVTFHSDEYLEINIYTGPVKVLYADIQNIVKGKWKVIGQSSLSEKDSDLLYHNIGGELWHGDIHSKTLSEDEYGNYPKFLRAGNKAIENMLAVGFGL